MLAGLGALAGLGELAGLGALTVALSALAAAGLVVLHIAAHRPLDVVGLSEHAVSGIPVSKALDALPMLSVAVLAARAAAEVHVPLRRASLRTL